MQNKVKNNSTYGEVTTVGNVQVLSYLYHHIPKENGKFLDIGCGYGKLVTYMAENTNMYCIGIDIDKEKINIAHDILWTNEAERIKFIYGDIQDNWKLVAEADFIFMNCVTWDPKLVSSIFQESNGIIIHNHTKAIKLKNGKWWDYPGEPAPVMCSWDKKNQRYYKLNSKILK